MKILMINYSEITAPGGVHKTIRELAKNLTIKGHEVIVIQSNPQKLPHEEIYDGYKIIRIKSDIGKFFLGINPEIYIYLKKHLSEIAPDIIHIHGYHSLYSLEIINILKNRNYPIVFSPYLDTARSTFTGKYLWNLYNLLFGKRLFKYVNYVVASSNFESQALTSIFNLASNKLSVIPLGVDSIDLTRHNISINSKIILLYSGYLIDRKNVSSIIKSLHELIYTYNYDNVTLKINGTGPDKENLVKLANILKVNDHISWSNFIPSNDFIKTLSESNIFLLLSKSEAFGITIAEALSTGTPCIVTKVTALEEFINEPGCYAVEYPPDPKEVARLIIDILNNNAKVGPLSNRIRVWEKVINDYEQLYLKLLEIGNVNEHT